MDEFDKDMVDLGSDPVGEDFDPFAGEDESGEGTPVETAQDADTEALAQEESTPETSAPTDTLAVATTKDTNTKAPSQKEADKPGQDNTEKPPVFEYAGATENIDDTSKTFDELRIEKSADFPELEDDKRVSWTVEYGKITKTVADPKGMSVGKMKSDIETSKEFEDSLKKRGADKNPTCKVKPRVTAQSKGLATATAYKSVYTNLDDAVASGKLITLFPARDGNVYEMRRNDMGRFITHSKGNPMLSEVKAGFVPALPRIPYKQLFEIISFFKLMALDGRNEALANIYWDKDESVFITDIPEQTFTPVSVKGITSPQYDNDRYIHYADIHSHNTMNAFFSNTDDRDEKATRVYVVVGNVLKYFPDIKVRISNGGTFLEIEPCEVFEDYNHMKKLASIWFNQLQYRAQIIIDMISSVFNRNKDDGDDL